MRERRSGRRGDGTGAPHRLFPVLPVISRRFVPLMCWHARELAVSWKVSFDWLTDILACLHAGLLDAVLSYFRRDETKYNAHTDSHGNTYSHGTYSHGNTKAHTYSHGNTPHCIAKAPGISSSLFLYRREGVWTG
jgi:hypothetical protein